MRKIAVTKNPAHNQALKESTERKDAGVQPLKLVASNATSDFIPRSLPPRSLEAKPLQSSTELLPEPSFQWERFHQIAHELPPLFVEHWREIALNQDAIPLSPDWDKFYNLDVQGILRILTVRLDKNLVGYVFLLVSSHLHYSTTLWAHADMFWTDPTVRAGWTGVKLFKILIRDARLMGAKNLTVTTKHHFMGGRVTKLLQRLGFVPIETVHSMRL